jgi:hypothetical protein
MTPAHQTGKWPCVHGTDCAGAGLDCGPDFTRQYTKRAAPKTAAEMSVIRARAWATRRDKYGERAHLLSKENEAREIEQSCSCLSYPGVAIQETRKLEA